MPASSSAPGRVRRGTAAADQVVVGAPQRLERSMCSRSSSHVPPNPTAWSGCGPSRSGLPIGTRTSSSRRRGPVLTHEARPLTGRSAPRPGPARPSAPITRRVRPPPRSSSSSTAGRSSCPATPARTRRVVVVRDPHAGARRARASLTRSTPLAIAPGVNSSRSMLQTSTRRPVPRSGRGSSPRPDRPDGACALVRWPGRRDGVPDPGRTEVLDQAVGLDAR